MKGFFITGSDTNVGKTYIACQIARELVNKNFNVIPRKPIESGCEKINDELIPSDAQKLMLASQYKLGLDKVCRYHFEPEISPAQAAKLSPQKISLADLKKACESHSHLNNDFLIVEGAGGFFSPLCENALNADLAVELNLPAVIIVEHKLGCINQALLTIFAAKKYSLKIHAVILNAKTSSENLKQNIDEIKQFTDVDIFSCLANDKLDSEFYTGL